MPWVSISYLRNRKILLNVAATLVSVCVLLGCNATAFADAENRDLTTYVDPLIGSDGHGHVFVGANVPFGAVQLGPSNKYQGWDWCSAYHYSDDVLIGFSIFI